MTDSEMFTEVLALHHAIRTNYRFLHNRVPVEPRGEDRGRMARFQITLSEIFHNDKKGRELRLDTLAAVLPLLKPGGRPVNLDSTNRLWRVELLALNGWLNAKSLRVLETVSLDPQRWAREIREMLGTIKRPGGTLATEEPQEKTATLFHIPQKAH